MKDSLAQITMVLDRSGSMESVRRPTVDGVNKFFEGQKNVPGDANVTLIQFDSENAWEIVFDDKPVKQTPKLTMETYVPRGGTPLRDAIGRTIVDLGEKLSKKPEGERPGKVIVVIMTDGLENASSKFSAPQIADMIKHQRETYKWEFIFLGANQDAILTGEAFNIPMASSVTYAASHAGTRAVMGITGQNVASYRMNKSANVAYNQQQREDALEEDEEPKKI